MAYAEQEHPPGQSVPASKGGDSRASRAGGSGGGGGGGALAGSLSGRLPCLKCGYDLQGLSILGDCPECGTAVRGTILALVDPLARELSPIRYRWLVAGGLVLWAGCGLLALLVVWAQATALLVRIWLDVPTTGPGLELPIPGLAWVVEQAPWLLAGLIWTAGLGLVMVARPNAQTPRWATGATLLAATVCAPLGLVAAWHASAPMSGRPGAAFSLAQLWASQGWAAWHRLMIAAGVIAVLLLFRPIARQLVQRSMALRSGRVDRQTLVAMVAAVGLFALGEGVGLLAAALGRQAPAAAELGSRGLYAFALAFMLLGGLLLTIGLAGALSECLQIARAIVWPGPSLGQVVHLSEPESAATVTPSGTGAGSSGGRA